MNRIEQILHSLSSTIKKEDVFLRYYQEEGLTLALVKNHPGPGENVLGLAKVNHDVVFKKDKTGKSLRPDQFSRKLGATIAIGRVLSEKPSNKFYLKTWNLYNEWGRPSWHIVIAELAEQLESQASSNNGMKDRDLVRVVGNILSDYEELRATRDAKSLVE